MKFYTWLVDKIVWFLVALFCAIVGTILAWYIHAIVMEMIQ